MALMLDEEELPSFNNTNDTRTSSFSEPDSLNVIIPLTVIYGIIFVTGILGNISTCVVIGRNRSMHTATNFYLFSLAISDLLLLICGLPLEVHRLWYRLSYPLGEALCITVGLISETSANATVLTITAFTVERYIAICRPFMSHKMSKLSRAVRYIIAIWICALCSAVPQAMQFGIVTYEENGLTISACTVKGHGVHQVFVISSFVFFVVPMSLITVLYVLIGVKLHTSRVLHPVKKSSVESGERNGTPRCRNGASQRRVIRMLVAVALSFFLCWAPFHVQRLIAIYGKNLEHPTDTFYQVYIVLTYLSGVLYFLSTSINPFLYNIMSNKFRNAFKVTLSLWCSRRDRSRLERTYSALLASQRERAAARAIQRPRHPRLLRRLSTASSQLCVAPPRAQSVNRSNLPVVNEESESWLWKQRLAEGSDSMTSPQSISNSSLHELDHELSGEELATYLYQVNFAVALSFFLCWAPFHVQRLIAIYGKNLEHPTDTFYQVYIVLTYLSGVLYFLSTSINPFLYNIMSNKFRNAFKVTLSLWCSRRDRSRLERTYSALLASQRERAAARTIQRPRHPRLLRRLSTASSQLCVAPPRAQSVNRSNLPVVNEESESWLWKQRLAEGSHSMTSPQSISNSSFHELDHELSGEELATYLYQVNCKIIGKT